MKNSDTKVQTELGLLTIPMLVCDTCGATAPTEHALGWVNLESLGPPSRLPGRTPEGGYQFCGWSCLSKAVNTVQANLN